MREMYGCLTGDSAASHDTDQTVVDERVQHIIRLQDPDIVADLRHLNEGRKKKHQVFWERCKKFIEQAVDNRRHGEVTHLSCAISVRDLVEQVTSVYPSWNTYSFYSVGQVAVLVEKSNSQSKLSVHWKIRCKIYGSSSSDKDVA